MSWLLLRLECYVVVTGVRDRIIDQSLECLHY